MNPTTTIRKYDENGLITREFYDQMATERMARCRLLHDQYKRNNSIINNKVKGQIRKAQARNKEINALLKLESESRDYYYYASSYHVA